MLQVCRGLFEAHRLIFSFLICTAIQRHTSGINSVELALLLGGPQPIPTSRPNPAPTVINPQQWGSLAALEEAVPSFVGLLRSVTLDTQQWLKWMQASSLGITGIPNFAQVTIAASCPTALLKIDSSCTVDLHCVSVLQFASSPASSVLLIYALTCVEKEWCMAGNHFCHCKHLHSASIAYNPFVEQTEVSESYNTNTEVCGC